MAVPSTASRGSSLKAMGGPKAPVLKHGGGRRSGRLGEPPGASGSLDDVPHRLRLPSCPADRPGDLYGSLSALIGITVPGGASGHDCVG